MAQLIEVILEIKTNIYKCSYDGTYKYKLPYTYSDGPTKRIIAHFVAVPLVGHYISIDGTEYYVEKVVHSEATVALKIIEER
jgi:hypothetical protein